jgi:hypothetical protein
LLLRFFLGREHGPFGNRDDKLLAASTAIARPAACRRRHVLVGGVVVVDGRIRQAHHGIRNGFTEGDFFVRDGLDDVIIVRGVKVVTGLSRRGN